MTNGKNVTHSILYDLVLTNEPISNAFSHTGNFNNITRLQICFCSNVSNVELFSFISQMPSLQQLSFFFCDCEIDKIMHSIAPLVSKLQSLSLSGCSKLSADGLRAMTTLSSLTKLKLDHCTGINSLQGYEVLSSLSHLSTLSLVNVQLNDKCFEQVARLTTSLQSLNIEENSYITDKSFRMVVSLLTNLTNLKVGVCQVTDKGWSNVTHLKQLKKLKILGSTNLTNNGLHFLSLLSDLQSLTLAYCDQLNNSSLAIIQQLQSLTHLELHSLNITRSAVEELEHSLTNLCFLSVKECYF